MLLTGGQISAAISSFIVFIFTSILFLSGYILQQRTVHNIQLALRPQPSPSLNSVPSETTIPVSYHRQQLLSTLASTQINWKRTAYVQLVRRHEDVCAAVMQFAELTRSKSPAQKALLYPSSWDEEMTSAGGNMGRGLRTSVRLLRKANEQYKVSLHPVIPVSWDTSDVEAQYPLARLLTLTMFERVVSLFPTGLVLDGGLLDTLFAADMDGSAVEVTGGGIAPQGVMMRPSMAIYQKAMKQGAIGDAMPGVMGTMDLARERPWMLSETSELIDEPTTGRDVFNSTEWYDMAAYVRFSDLGILGPQYDVPDMIIRGARPELAAARGVWEGVYDRFRVERMTVCGLDVEPLPKPTPLQAQT